MAVYTNISFKHIIGKLYRDLSLEDPNYELDFIEWGAEALYFIGSGSQLQKVQGLQLKVENHKAEIPYGLLAIKQLRYYHETDGKWRVIRFNPRNFNPHDKDSPNLRVNTKESYSLNPNYIETSFEEGIIELTYKRFPIDEDGYPLVPDNQYFIEALFWYCYKKMILQGYKPRVDEITYTYADEKWRFYCGAARNKANFPDLDQYERFRDIWVGLLPHQGLVENGFDLTSKEGIELDVVDASNVITRPLTVEKPKEDEEEKEEETPVEDTTPPTIPNATLTLTEL